MHAPGQSADRRRGANLRAQAISGCRPLWGQRRPGTTALAPAGSAASIAIEAQDAARWPPADAAAYAVPTSGQKAPASLKPREIEQKNRRVIPLFKLNLTSSPATN